MSKLILHFIQSNLFTLENLNDRIGTYDSGPEEGNRSPFLKMEKLKRFSLGLKISWLRSLTNSPFPESGSNKIFIFYFCMNF